MSESQPLLFAEEELCPWKSEWQGMPEFSCQNLLPKFQVLINFTCAGDLEDFARLIQQNIPIKLDRRVTPSVWFPEMEVARAIGHLRYRSAGEASE